MKTLQELYTEIIGSEELKKSFAEAAKGGKLADFLKENGCEATAEEIKAFLQEKSNQPLSEEELDSVAGGGCNETTKAEAFLSVVTVGLVCAYAAIDSSKNGHTGQATEEEGRLCND